jgi:hypothetical protein
MVLGEMYPFFFKGDEENIGGQLEKKERYW